MDITTRTNEGQPSECPICGKHSIVSSCAPLGDSICPHCGSLLLPELGLERYRVDGNYEKRLAEMGVLVETNDQGEIVVAELHGPHFNDKIIRKLEGFKDIPVIKLFNTGFSSKGIERLRELLPQTSIEIGE